MTTRKSGGGTTKRIKIPSPTQWISVEENHIPRGVWCNIFFADEDGNECIAIAYKSKDNDAWIASDGTVIEERGVRVHHYSIITNLNMKTIAAV